ncbi:unnamed protein product [Bemisia tabaci]|uniref:acid phosphatase n=1 Tax=Bemisia tabaci TaxID=7038 RepID=A0A9P0AMM4_BEMTA|nr:unnamed protein product [Bemisia tabaci]
MQCYKPKRWNMFLVMILAISVITASVGFYVFRAGSAAEATLRFVSIVHRHGDRAPERSYPLDPYKDKSFWPDGLGALSQRGKIGVHRLGNFLRQRYDGFLSAKYSPSEIFVFSSFYDRCLMSASLVLAGLYPPVGLQLWNPDLKWQPIPIHTVPLPYDDIIRVSKHCPLLSKEEANWQNVTKLKLAENQELLANISKGTGIEMKTISDVYHINDNLKVVEEEGLALPQWAHSIDRERLRSLANIGTFKHFATPAMNKLKSGVLINKILRNMNSKANTREKFERQMNLYSAHDSTIGNIWRGLNVTSDIESLFPSYGAAVMIELHEIDGKYRVKILYKRSHLDDDLIVLKTEGCKESWGKETDAMCDLDIFSSALQHVVIDNFDKACEIPTEHI